VPDLSANDFRVSDNGSPQQVTAFRRNQSNGPRALVLLFDLLNLNLANVGFEWQQIKRSLPEMPASESLYLYLLVKDGSLYAVHGLPPDGAVPAQPDTSWIQNIGPLLDTAMQKVNQLRPTDIRTQVNIRFQATYNALDNLRSAMATVPGRKELVWVTYGIPSSIRFVGGEWFDCTPLLRQLAGRFNAANVAVYTVDPGMNLARGMLNRDALQVLTGNTGGRSFASSDLRQAAVQAVADARMNYSIQYTPTQNNWDGKYHQVRVACNRKGVHVQTEQGYFAPGPK
jgi:VWFA-related protein